MNGQGGKEKATNQKRSKSVRLTIQHELAALEAKWLKTYFGF
jgi:hypothetical protein